MWGLPRPGLEPVSPALAGRLSTTAPPGKPPVLFLYWHNQHITDDYDIKEEEQAKFSYEKTFSKFVI